MRLRNLTLIFGFILALTACESREPQTTENNNNNGGGSGSSNGTLTFKNVDYPLKHAVVVSYGEENPGEYNFEYMLHDGSSATAQDYNVVVYADLLTSDSTKLEATTYDYDASWQVNTFDYAEVEIVSGPNAGLYDVTGGGITISVSDLDTIATSVSFFVDDNGNTEGAVAAYAGSVVYE